MSTSLAQDACQVARLGLVLHDYLIVRFSELRRTKGAICLKN